MKSYKDEDLVAWLSDADEILRNAAAFELHVRGGGNNFDAVKRLANAVRHEPRAAVARVLGQFGTPTCPHAAESFPILAELFRDAYSEVRIEAISAIGHLASLGKDPPDDLVRGLLNATRDPQAKIREAVGYALLSVPGLPVDEALMVLATTDKEVNVREAAEFSIVARQEIREGR